jgi:hypothetical protein
MKKTVLTKNPLANDVTKHVRLIFSPAGEILSLFSVIQTVVPFQVFESLRQMRFRMQQMQYCMRYRMRQMRYRMRQI